MTKDSYTENTLTLEEDGSFTLKVVAEEAANEISGKFDVTDASDRYFCTEPKRERNFDY